MAKLADRTYGQALFDLSVEEGKVDEYAQQVQFIARAFEENPQLLELLNHPQITREEKLEVLTNCFSGRVADDLTGFLVIIVKAGRQNFIPGIFEYFLDAVKEYKHIGVAHVTSAVALSQAQQSALEKRLLDTTDYVDFEMHFHVDASLIGGMVIRIGDKVVDSSIKTKLETLSRKLMKVQL